MLKKQNHPEHITNTILIFGSTIFSVEDRIAYFKKLRDISTINNIIFLTEFRFLNKEELSYIKKRYNREDLKTENDIIVFLGDRLKKEYPCITVEISNGKADPNNSKGRATTESTLKDLLSSNLLDIKSIDAISSYPYVSYQQSVVDGVLKKINTTTSINIVGNPEIENIITEDKIPAHLDLIAKIIYNCNQINQINIKI